MGLLRDDGSLLGSKTVRKKGFQQRRVRTSRGAGRRLLDRASHQPLAHTRSYRIGVRPSSFECGRRRFRRVFRLRRLRMQLETHDFRGSEKCGKGFLPGLKSMCGNSKNRPSAALRSSG
jgi:hypothetical protein